MAFGRATGSTEASFGGSESERGLRDLVDRRTVGQVGDSSLGSELPQQGHEPSWEADFTVGRGEGKQHLGGEQSPWKERMSGLYGQDIETRQRRNATEATALSRMT